MTLDAITRFYFNGFNGIGGWVVLFVICMVFVAWIIADSETREIHARVWIVAVILPLIPLIISGLLDLYDGISVDFTTDGWSLAGFVAFAGITGKIFIVGITIAYFVAHWNHEVVPLIPVEALSNYGYTAQQTVIEIPPEKQAGISSNQQTKIDIEPNRGKPPAGYLRVPGTEQAYNIYEGRNKIGRSDDGNDIILSDGYVSRFHAIIWAVNGQYIITDWSSKTGVYVNQHRVGPEGALLFDSVMIQLGHTRLEFCINPQVAPQYGVRYGT